MGCKFISYDQETNTLKIRAPHFTVYSFDSLGDDDSESDSGNEADG